MNRLRHPVQLRDRDLAIDAPLGKQRSQHRGHWMFVAVNCLQDGRDLGDDDDLVRERVLVLAVIDERHR
jgi:hypothetical protein